MAMRAEPAISAKTVAIAGSVKRAKFPFRRMIAGHARIATTAIAVAYAPIAICAGQLQLTTSAHSATDARTIALVTQSKIATVRIVGLTVARVTTSPQDGSSAGMIYLAVLETLRMEWRTT